MLASSSGFTPVIVVFVVLSIALRLSRVAARGRRRRQSEWPLDRPTTTVQDKPVTTIQDKPATMFKAPPPPTTSAPTTPAAEARPPASAAPTASAAAGVDDSQFGTPDFGPPLDFGPTPDSPST